MMQLKAVLVVALSVACLSLGGCATTSQGTWEISGKCSGLPSKPSCEIGGKIGGTWGGGGGGNKKLVALAQQVLVAADVADAAQFSIDVSGSTITYPDSGIVTLMLKNRSTGVVRATKDFSWIRSGSILKLADPDSVNNWALSSGGDANEITYSLKRFQVNSGYGEQVISVASKYEDVVTAAATSTYYRCTAYPSPYACRID